MNQEISPELREQIAQEELSKRMRKAVKARWDKATPEYRKAWGQKLLKSRQDKQKKS